MEIADEGVMERLKRTRLTCRSVIGFGSLLVVAFAVALSLLFLIAKNIDKAEQEENFFYAAKALEARSNSSATYIQSCAIRTEAF